MDEKTLKALVDAGAPAVKLKPGEHNRLRREYARTPESYDLFLHAR